VTQNFPHSAAQNIPLLTAIKAGPYASVGELAAAADVVPNNMTRKLGVLLEDGIIRSIGSASHQVELTEAGEQALRANALFRGELPEAAFGDGGGVREIPFNRIVQNPRTQFDPVKDEELALSIGDKGVLQAIKVRPKGDDFEVIIGERRRRARRSPWPAAGSPPTSWSPANVRDSPTRRPRRSPASRTSSARTCTGWTRRSGTWPLRPALGRRDRAAGRRRRGKRSIQDYIKCARELSPADVARPTCPTATRTS
jgi:hypothetical protein